MVDCGRCDRAPCASRCKSRCCPDRPHCRSRTEGCWRPDKSGSTGAVGRHLEWRSRRNCRKSGNFDSQIGCWQPLVDPVKEENRQSKARLRMCRYQGSPVTPCSTRRWKTCDREPVDDPLLGRPLSAYLCLLPGAVTFNVTPYRPWVEAHVALFPEEAQQDFETPLGYRRRALLRSSASACRDAPLVQSSRVSAVVVPVGFVT